MPLYRNTIQAPQLVSYGTPPYITGSGAYYWMHPSTAVATAKCIDINGSIGALPWLVPNTITLTQIGIDVTNVTSVDNGAVLRFGIYNDTGQFLPGTLIADLGTVLGWTVSSTNPSFTAAFSLNLQAGLYWVAMVPQGASTARPTTGSIAINATPIGTWTTVTGGHAIPLIGGTQRSFYGWTPTTNPALTAVTTSLAVASPWGGGYGTSSNAWPRFAIHIA